MESLRGLLSDARTARDGIVIVRVFFVATLIAAAVVEIATACAANSFASGLQFLGLNLILGGAAGLIGGVIGFIFGIPRALTDEAPPQSQPAVTAWNNRRSKTNTNLEQISDWLTKILVGASLASLATLPHFMAKTASYLGSGAYKGLPGEGILALFIALYFLALGFYWSYIETRTSLTVLFDTYQADISDDVILRLRSAAWEPGSSPIPEDSIILGTDAASLTSPALLEARAAAETRAGDYQAAILSYKRAQTLDPGNPRLQTRLSVLLATTGNVSAADSLVQTLKTAAGSNTTQQNLLDPYRVYNALYKPPPGGFQEAISIGESLLQTSQASNGDFQLWMACAYGQRCRYAHPGYATEPVPADDPDRIKALDALKEMKRIKPDLVSNARTLWHPSPGSPEDDLVVFKDDPDFAAVLNAP
jgi:tetratricopeptide (TPR) repeat protein